MRFSGARAITILSAYRTTIAISQGASEPNASITIHIVIDGNHTAQLFNATFYLTKGEERVVRIAVDHGGTNGIISCTWGICCQQENVKSLDKVLISKIETRIWFSSMKAINII